QLFADNLARFLAGEPVHHEVARPDSVAATWHTEANPGPPTGRGRPTRDRIVVAPACVVVAPARSRAATGACARRAPGGRPVDALLGTAGVGAARRPRSRRREGRAA